MTFLIILAIALSIPLLIAIGIYLLAFLTRH